MTDLDSVLGNAAQPTLATASPSSVVATTTPTTPQLTVEQKIDFAIAEASKVTAVFSPAISQALSLGLEVEPLFQASIQAFIAIFKHHAKVQLS